MSRKCLLDCSANGAKWADDVQVLHIVIGNKTTIGRRGNQKPAGDVETGIGHFGERSALPSTTSSASSFVARGITYAVLKSVAPLYIRAGAAKKLRRN